MTKLARDRALDGVFASGFFLLLGREGREREKRILATSYFRATLLSHYHWGCSVSLLNRVRNGNGWGRCARVTRRLGRMETDLNQVLLVNSLVFFPGLWRFQDPFFPFEGRDAPFSRTPSLGRETGGFTDFKAASLASAYREGKSFKRAFRL